MIVLVLLFIFICLFVWLSSSPRTPLEKDIERLDTLYREGSVPTISTEELSRQADNVIAVAERDSSSERGGTIENYTPLTNPIDYKYWPQYYYSYPYHYKQGAAWPPSMFSRLTYWTPGFQTSGWRLATRPGIYHGHWPRSRWVTDNNKFYFINNNDADNRT